MHTLARGFAVVCALVAVGVGAPALAAPDRLNDDVPSAFPDDPGAWAFSYSREMIDLEGALTSSSTAHDYFKLRYTFSPKVAASVRYTLDDLNGGLAIVNPVFNNQDSSSSFEIDLRTNLLNVPATPANEEEKQEFTAGSAFSLGVSGSFYQLDAGNLGRNENLIKAYLLYTTDLTEEMTAHTYFSSGRLAGDESSGSVNRIGAGIDYVLVPGDRPLTLLVNGVLDIFNFREPNFNTSRVSRFDVGLRYRVSHDWFASLGWVTANDSENDASGSGLFAGLNYVQMPRPCVECPPVEETPVEGTPAEGEQTASAQADAALAALPPAAASSNPTAEPAQPKQRGSAPSQAEMPSLMAGAGYSGSVNRFEKTQPPADSGKQVASAADNTSESDAIEENDAGEPAFFDPLLISSGPDRPAVHGGPYYFDPERAEENKLAVAALAEQESQSPPSTGTDNGISIPPFPEAPPHHTPASAVMVRAGLELPLETPQPTVPGQRMTRAPQRSAPPASVGEAAEDVDEALERAIAEDTYASTGTGQPQA